MKDPQDIMTDVGCTEEEKLMIKMLDSARACQHCHEPNEETQQVLKETDSNLNLLEHETLEDFWHALGFNRHA